MRRFLPYFLLLLLSAVQGVGSPASSLRNAAPQSQTMNLVGRWQVKYTLAGIGEKNLVFDSQAKGAGSFVLLDAGPDDKSPATPLPAAWSQATDDRVNFSGEVELPIGTCCRETGTLIFKGKFHSGNSISGKAIFVTSTVDEENFNGFRSMVGTFTATRRVQQLEPGKS
jgi:hypothetical protein